MKNSIYPSNSCSSESRYNRVGLLGIKWSAKAEHLHQRGAPRLIHSPEEWHHLKWNLQTREPSQTAFLNNLFTAYNAN